MTAITLSNINKRFGEKVLFRDYSLHIEAGEFVAIKGESGAGKTTLLNIIGLLETPDSGSVTLCGARNPSFSSRAAVHLRRHKLSYLFQNYGLVDTDTVEANMKLATRFGKAKGKAEKERIADALAQVGLSGYERRKVYTLSGGEQQRVALARILCSQPEVILLDEPFSALDSYLKWDLELKLSDFLENFSGPILWVSHDRGEVFRNCKRVCVLDQGASQGTFTLRQLFHEPETEAAARLSGCKNIVEAVPAGSAVTLPAWGLTLNCGKPVPADVRQAGIRARHVMTVPEGTPDAFYCTVERVIQDVFTTIVLLRPEHAAPDAPPLRMELEREDAPTVLDNQLVWISVQPRDILLLR